MPPKYPYRAVCWKTCYWKDNLWQPGEVYEGQDPPGKYFMKEGEDPPEEEVMDAGSDPRPNVELKKILKDKFGFNVPSRWKRRQIWVKLKEMEIAESKDELTNPESSQFEAKCGFIAASKAGVMAHERACELCQSVSQNSQGKGKEILT